MSQHKDHREEIARLLLTAPAPKQRISGNDLLWFLPCFHTECCVGIWCRGGGGHTDNSGWRVVGRHVLCKSTRTEYSGTGKETPCGWLLLFQMDEAVLPESKAPPRVLWDPPPSSVCCHWVNHVGAEGTGEAAKLMAVTAASSRGDRGFLPHHTILLCYCRTTYITHAFCPTSCTLATQNSHSF